MNRRHFFQFGAAGIGLMALRQIIDGEVVYGLPPSDNSSKYTTEALYYKKTANGFECNLCPKNCNLNAIRPGECKTKEVRNDRLISTAYGNPYYVNTETPELESLYHFKPGSKMLTLGTAGCTLVCMYCKVFEVSKKSPAEIIHRTLFPEQVIQQCVEKGIKTITYAYTEPVAFFEYMLATAKLAHQHGIQNVMISNGFINEAPLRELAHYLDAAVIDVKAFNDATYQKLTTGSIFPVFNTLKVLKELHVWTEITHLLVPEWTDNFELLKKMCDWMIENGFGSTPFHFNKFQPMYRLTRLPATPEPLLQKARETAIASGLKFVYLDNDPVNESQQTICPKCKKVVIDRKGYKMIANQLKNGKCSNCNEAIPGIWL